LNAEFDGYGASAVSCGISLSQTALSQHTAGLAGECCMYLRNVKRTF